MLQNALLCASLPRTIGSALLASHIRAARSAALTVPGSELVLRADCLNAATSRGWGVPRRASPIGRIFELCRTSQLITTSFNADGLVLLAVFFRLITQAQILPAGLRIKESASLLREIPLTWINYARYRTLDFLRHA